VIRPAGPVPGGAFLFLPPPSRRKPAALE